MGNFYEFSKNIQETDSGLKVNDSKTELCKFHKTDTSQVEIILNNIVIKSQNSINVLGVEFDSKLNWTPQVNKTIIKANKTFHAIKLIKKYFTSKELLSLLTSNYYSMLFYNSEIWHLPTLSPEIKQLLLSASAHALKLTQKYVHPMQSFENIHKECNRATPEKMHLYKHALLLYKLYNTNLPHVNWIALNFQQINSSRNANFNVIKTNNY